MGKILVKAPQAMMSPSGEMQFLYGGQEKGGDRGSLPARVLGGAGKFVGGLLGTTGRHQSLQSLLGGIQGGAATGGAAGRWAGGFADKLPGGRVRVARRKQIQGEADKFAEQEAERSESKGLGGRITGIPSAAGRWAAGAIPFAGVKGKRRQLDQRRMDATEAGYDQEFEDMKRRKGFRDIINQKTTNPMDELVQGTADAAPASEAATRRALEVMNQQVDPREVAEREAWATLGFPEEEDLDLDTSFLDHNTANSVREPENVLMGRVIPQPFDNAAKKMGAEDQRGNVPPQNAGTGDAYSQFATNMSRFQQQHTDEYENAVNPEGDEPWWNRIQRLSQEGQPEAGAPPA